MEVPIVWTTPLYGKQPRVASAGSRFRLSRRPDVPSLFLLEGALLSPLWDVTCDRNKNEQSGSSGLCPAVSPSPFLSEYIIASEEIVDLFSCYLRSERFFVPFVNRSIYYKTRIHTSKDMK